MPPSFVRLRGLRELRLRALLTQEQLAERAGIWRGTVARIENGSPTKVTTAHALARALGVRPVDLRIEHVQADEG